MITLTTYKWIPDFAQPLMRALRVRWALEEAGMPYGVRTVRHDKRMEPDHLARQPFAQCPAIEDNGLTLFESGAIALYIAKQSEALMPKDHIQGARAIAWVFAALNSIEIAVQQLGEIDFFHKDAAWAKERRPMVEAFTRHRLGQLAQALGERAYLEGRFTVGDLMMADVLRILGDGPILNDFPTLKAYRDRCMARPAYLRAMAAQMDGFKQAA
ncbi:MAG TPA: glutathione S-transferase family protein [Hyphomonadaceae bacterium]|jgi:glutathione S-transferase|nr:glutathione S-transferase family protein [Hyphomonadaceae bacterium]